MSREGIYGWLIVSVVAFIVGAVLHAKDKRGP